MTATATATATVIRENDTDNGKDIVADANNDTSSDVNANDSN